MIEDTQSLQFYIAFILVTKNTKDKNGSVTNSFSVLKDIISSQALK